MEFIRYMPAVAFIPLIMLWAGIGEWAKILLIFIGCFFQLVSMVAMDTRLVSKDLVQASSLSAQPGGKRSRPLSSRQCNRSCTE